VYHTITYCLLPTPLNSTISSTQKSIVMPTFDTAHVKNIALLGHAGSGKTTLAECMIFEAGLINRRGTIAEQNTVIKSTLSTRRVTTIS
jgi:translation elongation factor EF-G